MKVLVIGSNSFTARSFINLCLQKNNNVIGVSRSKLYRNNDFDFSNRNFKFYRIDVNKKFEKLKSIINYYKPGIIINYTAQGEVRNSWKYPEHWYKTNFEFVFKLSNFLVKKKFLKKFIQISTPEVYGSIEKKIDPVLFFNPSTPYAVSKAAADLHLNSLYKRYKFPVVYTRSTNVYGPGQQLFRIIPKSIILLMNKKKITLNNLGNTKRDFVHVDDVAKFTMKCIKMGIIGSAYHCSSLNPPKKISFLVKIICNKLNLDFKKFVKLTKENFGQDQCYHISSRKTIRDLKWKPEININNGIDETINWVLKNFTKLRNKNLNYKHLR